MSNTFAPSYECYAHSRSEDRSQTLHRACLGLWGENCCVSNPIQTRENHFCIDRVNSSSYLKEKKIGTIIGFVPFMQQKKGRRKCVDTMWHATQALHCTVRCLLMLPLLTQCFGFPSWENCIDFQDASKDTPRRILRNTATQNILIFWKSSKKPLGFNWSQKQKSAMVLYAWMVWYRFCNSKYQGYAKYLEQKTHGSCSPPAQRAGTFFFPCYRELSDLLMRLIAFFWSLLALSTEYLSVYSALCPAPILNNTENPSYKLSSFRYLLQPKCVWYASDSSSNVYFHCDILHLFFAAETWYAISIYSLLTHGR